MKKRYLMIALGFLSIISLLIGVQKFALIDLLKLEKDTLDLLILSRFPRLISIIVTGAGMSISGLIMQQISRNKFVSPTTAATVDSARLGVLVSMILFQAASPFNKMLIAFIFSIVGTFLFMLMLRRIKFKNIIFVPLLGIMFGNLIDSITTFFAYRFNLIQSLIAWTIGDFSLIIKGRYELLLITIPLVIVAFLYANKFTVAGMGEDFSKNLGLNYNRVINIGLIIVSLVTAAVLVTVGSVPFLGLIVPNIISIYNGDNLSKTIWETSLFGACFLLVCDIIGRLIIFPYEVAIGLTVGVIGSIIFLILLLRRVAYEK